MSGFLYVLVGICHVQTRPDGSSVHLRSEDNIAAPFFWLVSNIFYDIHLLSLVQNLIKFVLSGRDILSFCTAPIASGSTCNFTLTPLKPSRTRKHIFDCQLSLAEFSPDWQWCARGQVQVAFHETHTFSGHTDW